MINGKLINIIVVIIIIIIIIINVKKIWGLNLPGTLWATSACRGKPLLYFT